MACLSKLAESVSLSLMTSTNFAQATLHLEHVRDAADGLAELYAVGSATPATVGRLQNEIRHSSTIAKLHFMAAIVERLTEIGELLDDGRLSWDEVDQAIGQAASEVGR